MTWNENSSIKLALINYFDSNYSGDVSSNELFDRLCIIPSDQTIYFHFDANFPDDERLKMGVHLALEQVASVHRVSVVREADRTY